ncbi:MAG: hypothetical protein CMJ78_20300 [Planctomycetaceae bacterium]|nr:hypothetical protein [Planctomycetaceae bacterium]
MLMTERNPVVQIRQMLRLASAVRFAEHMTDSDTLIDVSDVRQELWEIANCQCDFRELWLVVRFSG